MAITETDYTQEASQGFPHGHYHFAKITFGTPAAAEILITGEGASGIEVDDHVVISMEAVNGDAKNMEYKIYVSNRLAPYTTMADVITNCSEITGGVAVAANSNSIVPTKVILAIGGTNYNVDAADYHWIYISAKTVAGATAADNQDLTYLMKGHLV